MNKFALLPLLALGAGCADSSVKEEKKKAINILWITCEDMSPRLGCYGDELARTPYIDSLASEGIRFTNVYSVSGVCAPSRAALITGMYPTSFGAMHMRTTSRTSAIDKITDPELLAIPVYEAVPPPGVKCFSEFLRAEGYYCTNNHKTDYQFHVPVSAWDESSQDAHWKNRPNENTPFFAVFNITTTHESQIWKRAGDTLITDPANVKVPPYYPDTPVVRRDLARMYDNIALMDQRVGELLNELEEAGLEDNTIVFFYSDHGDGTPRAKRWLYDSGLKVPLIVRFPDGRAKATVNDDLISFVDFAPTVLSLTGISIPDYMEGYAFLDENKAKKRDYIFAARDRMDPGTDRARAVRDKKFKYIINYEPHKPFVQFIPYRDQMALMQELHKYNREGKLDSLQALWFRNEKPVEELYDTQNDPHELYNLAGRAEYQKILEKFRQAHIDWKSRFGDMGNLPEPELIKQLWPPDGQQPVTARVKYEIRNDSVYLSCDTEGASIVYRTPADTINGNSHWQLYTHPVPVTDNPFSATSIRIGYKQSEIAGITTKN